MSSCKLCGKNIQIDTWSQETESSLSSFFQGCCNIIHLRAPLHLTNYLLHLLFFNQTSFAIIFASPEFSLSLGVDEVVLETSLLFLGWSCGHFQTFYLTEQWKEWTVKQGESWGKDMRLACGSPTRPGEKGEAVNQLKIYEICLYFPLTPKIIGLNHQPYIVISEFTTIGRQMYWGKNSCGSSTPVAMAVFSPTATGTKSVCF